MWMKRGLLTLMVSEKDATPPPPMEIMKAFGISEEEERRIESATHVVMAASADPVGPPRFGFWSALGAARAVATARDGVVFDSAFPRVMALSSYQGDLPVDCRIVVADHIGVPFSVSERGKAWMTTTAMTKFGLPNIEVRDVPPDMANPLLPVVNAVAQFLVESTTKEFARTRQPLKELTVGPEIKLDVALIARAFGDEPPEPEAGVRGWSLVGLTHEKPRRGQEQMLQLVPPSSFPGEQGVWLHDLLGDLFKSKKAVKSIDKESRSLQEAHARALAELAGVKKRFQDGLRPGECFYVKHGFPTGTGDTEYMWITVSTWQGDCIKGQLANDPIHRLDLRAGQDVELREPEVFDWLLSLSDGRHEGGYTNVALGSEGVDIEDDEEE